MKNDPPEIVAAQAVSPSQPRGPHAAGVQPASPQIVIQNHQGSPLTRWFTWLGWMGFMLCIPIILGMSATYSEYFDTSEGLQESYHSLSETAKNKVAVIRAEGTIMTSEGYIHDQIKRVRDDDKVKAVVLRVNSPGGTVSASDNLYYQLNELRKDRKIPIVVSMGGMAASGGYYISMAVGDEKNTIFAEPTTTTGSIGVIIPHYNISKLLERWDVVNDSIVSHPRKELLSITKPPSEEDREILQNYVNESFDRFKKIVKSGRPQFREDPAALDVLATGEIFSGEQAQKHGLVDKLGYLADAIDRAAELAGLDVKNVRAVEYRGMPSLLDVVGAAKLNGSARSQGTGQPMLDDLIRSLAVPRAYYLFTSCAGWE